MNLIKLKIRGLGTTPETHWLDIGPGLTFFYLPRVPTARAFVNAIQTLNPPYDCRTQKPYSNMLATIKENGYTRVVRSHKRTVALAVFTSTPPLVEQLVACSPLFYETDRIEVGRRLDYSRWINFIELASSTRWSEISEDIMELCTIWGDDSNACVKDSLLLEQLRPTDRIQDGVMEQLEHLLDGVSGRVPENRLEHVQKLVDMVRRARHFNAARKIINKRLPFFFIIDHCRPTIHRIKAGDSTPPEVKPHPVEFLLQQLYSRSAGKNGGPDQDSRLPEAVNRELLRLQSKQVIRLEPDGRSYRLEGGYQKRSITDGDPVTSVQALKENCNFIIASAKVLTGSSPVLLFHQEADAITAPSREDINRVILELTAHCQCLVICQDKGLPEQSGGAMCHYSDDFMVKRGVS